MLVPHPRLDFEIADALQETGKGGPRGGEGRTIPCAADQRGAGTIETLGTGFKGEPIDSGGMNNAFAEHGSLFYDLLDHEKQL